MVIKCGWCGVKALKDDVEILRHMKRGRKVFFCTLKCAMKHNNAPRKKPIIEKICICGKRFKTKTDKTEYHYCSRPCRAKGGYTKSKEKAIDLSRKRLEAWRYVEISKELNSRNIPYEIEMRIEQFVYDLALLKERIIVEFDGPDHKWGKTKINDRMKDAVAKKNNWKLIRIPVEPNAIFAFSTFATVLPLFQKTAS